MRAISETLLKAQQSPSHVPYVEVEASSQMLGVTRLNWERLYYGSEPEFVHSAAVCGDGTLIRARLAPASEGRKLYRQAVPHPGTGSDFESWTYTGQYDCLALACAASGEQAFIFWINSSRELRMMSSGDSGLSWGSPQTIDYAATTGVSGMAAACKPNGDIAVFFADQSVLYVKKRAGGVWQAAAAWDKATGELSGVAAVYDGDWHLVVTGADADGSLKVWSLFLGDGALLPQGTWSTLAVMDSAAADAGFQFSAPYLDRPDVFRCSFAERCEDAAPYVRPFFSYLVPDTPFPDGLWREPAPFPLSTEYGVAIGHSPAGGFAWLSTCSGVWRAALQPERLDLSADVLSLTAELKETGGDVTIELRNDDGRYATLPGCLKPGSSVEISPGYITGNGAEVSPGLIFTIESFEHRRRGGICTAVIRAVDGWRSLEGWTARDQFRWNAVSAERSISGILRFLLGRAGLRLEEAAASEAATSSYPDFTVHAGDGGRALVDSLLDRVPDFLRIEGSVATLIDTHGDEPASYSYGSTHPVLEAEYRETTPEPAWVRLEGSDETGSPLRADVFAWDALNDGFNTLRQVEDSTLVGIGRLVQCGEAVLRKANVAAGRGTVLVPVNCGQQLYDVISPDDPRPGFPGAARILGIVLIYQPAAGRYLHRLRLGSA